MHPRLARGVAALAALALTTTACGDDNDAPADGTRSEGAPAAAVAFAGIGDGDQVSSPVQFEMKADNVTVEPAGEVREGAGHFHVIVDAGCAAPGELIPSDAEGEGYYHFGKAQTDAELELDPGEHTLCLQLGDGAHTALDLTDEVTVTVSNS